MGFIDKINAKVAVSPVGRWFKLEGCGHPKERKGSLFFTEIRGGLACFFAMAYIIAVNASIVADSGGTCVCNTRDIDRFCLKDTDYLMCTQQIKRDAVTATAAISSLATFCMGLFANMPVGLAPGMGLNAYFTYTVVGLHGTGPVPYQVALTAIFIEGFIFFGLALFGMRHAGIGLFLTLIGLTYSEGIALVVGATATPSSSPAAPREPSRGWHLPQLGQDALPRHVGGHLCGGIFTTILMMYKVRGAIIAGIVLVSIISWPRTTPVVDFHKISKILNVQEWNISGYGGQFGLALITFLYVDILDCTGTLYGMARFANLIDPVTQDFEGSSIAYMVDALSISSGAGISEGGKTGLTAVVAGLCFFISIFFAPIFASIPPWATGCVLILVGSMMVGSVTEINWRYLGDGVPAFLTIALMPFTYSIADGLIAGICSYICLNTIVWLIKVASGGRIVPPNYEERDGWTYRIPGGFFPVVVQSEVRTPSEGELASDVEKSGVATAQAPRKEE
ncbi:unnamed protein product [Parascedosporium putredinis]|uniref:Xanthine/uracil permease n=2 Tax=Parascedosporium putredinis TaxID=1442378 RepID=A0A9P1MG76_9PEZI|nr:unnamed protein product [Parascedosporium putredinis]CAI8003930.1 unnamed protein product [Parascedosporium putredinis]